MGWGLFLAWIGGLFFGWFIRSILNHPKTIEIPTIKKAVNERVVTYVPENCDGYTELLAQHNKIKAKDPNKSINIWDRYGAKWWILDIGLAGMAMQDANFHSTFFNWTEFNEQFPNHIQYNPLRDVEKHIILKTSEYGELVERAKYGSPTYEEIKELECLQLNN